MTSFNERLKWKCRRGLLELDLTFDRFLRHCARYWKIAPRVYPRGVFKFRSVEEARHPDR